MKMRPELLFICSRCKLGKSRVFYVVWRWSEWFNSGKPIASGYVETIEAAETLMAGMPEIVTCREAQIWRDAGYASHYHRKLAEERRRQRSASSEQGSTAIEFVYTFFHGEDGEGHISPHRIIRRTRQRIFVNIHEYYDGNDFYDGRTYALDRAQLEQTGLAKGNKRRWWETFYVSEEALRLAHPFYFGDRVPIDQPQCLTYFGLKLPTNSDSLKAVYRERIKQVHPDHGGSVDNFRELQSQYETALAFINRTGGGR
jgi:hypothetical protein